MKKKDIKEQRKLASRKWRKMCNCLLFLLDVYYELIEKNQKLKKLLKKLCFTESGVVDENQFTIYEDQLNNFLAFERE